MLHCHQPRRENKLFTGIEMMTKILMQRFGSTMASNYWITLNFIANLRKLVKKLVKLVRKKLIKKSKEIR